MDHEAFATRIKSALKAKSEGRSEDAAAEVRTLLHDLAPAVKAGVNEWHHQQALSLLVIVLDVAGKEQDCRAAWFELVQFTERATAYWQEALSSARADFERWNLEHPSEADRK
jgi:hypothetical protein